MSCYHPLIGWPDGYTENGKVKYKIFPRELFVDVPEYDSYGRKQEFIQVPCGKCIGCRLDYSRDWANRLMMELNYHDSAYFVTLTYDDDHVPKREYVDQCTGEVCTSLSLCKRDIQLFYKRLRRAFPDDHIRHYTCGEYGSDTFRPHYHAIIFGLHLDDLKVYKRSPRGFTYYNSQKLQDVWSVPDSDPRVPLGYCVVAEVDWNTCAYTARYVTKKLSGPLKVFYDEHCIEPPWSVMSRKPGIAHQFYLDHPDGMKRDELFLSLGIDGGKKVKPPRYFDKLYDLDFPEDSAIVKEQRKLKAELSQAAELAKTDLLLNEYLVVKEDAKLKQIKILKRSEI